MTPEMRTRIVAEARTWRGTHYQHQAHLKGVGCDCWGLVRGVGEALKIMAVDEDMFRTYAGYSRLPNPKKMGKGLAVFLREISREESGPGDVVWIAWRKGVPMHLGILADDRAGLPTMIHAEGVVGYVAEVGLLEQHRELIQSYWRFPGAACG